MRTHLHLDPVGGIAGDMLLAALLDAGGDKGLLLAAMAPLPLEPWHLHLHESSRCGIRGLHLSVHAEHDHATTTPTVMHHALHLHHRSTAKPAQHQHEHRHTKGCGHRRATEVLAWCARLDAPLGAKQLAERAVMALATAEGRIHGIAATDVHFHELGALDSVVDLLGASVLLHALGAASVSCGSLPMGQGMVRCAHGLMPLPAPATALLLEGMPIHGTTIRGETVTPTGAALLRALKPNFAPPPAMTLRRVGHGLGTREQTEIPNLLRVMVGQLEPNQHHAQAGR
jgi:hypothetical protein